MASLRAMQEGLFSADPRKPWRADAAALASLSAARLGEAFQHGPQNPLARAGGQGLAAAPPRRRRRGPARTCSARRPGSAISTISGSRSATICRAPEMLRLLLHAFGPIWPGRLLLGGVPLGDCGRHRAVPGDGIRAVSQAQPMARLFADRAARRCRVHRHRHRRADRPRRIPQRRSVHRHRGHRRRATPSCRADALDPFAEEIVEWRALTIALLDRLAEQVRQLLGVAPSAFPLARVLEGGSWAAGREIAAERRPDGAPPLLIASDGTVF